MLKIKGDSMVDVGIMDKDYIIVDAADTRADNGKIVVALINGESATVKTIEKKNGKIWLIPQNSAYEPMIFEPDQVKVMGSVTGVFRVY
jgi:lexA repressor